MLKQEISLLLNTWRILIMMNATTGLVHVNALILARVSKSDLEIVTLLYLSTIEVLSLTRYTFSFINISYVLNQPIGVEILLTLISRLYLFITIFVFCLVFRVRFAKKLLFFGWTISQLIGLLTLICRWVTLRSVNGVDNLLSRVETRLVAIQLVGSFIQTF